MITENGRKLKKMKKVMIVDNLKEKKEKKMKRMLFAMVLALAVLFLLFSVAKASLVSLWVDYSIVDVPFGDFGGVWTCVELKDISMPAPINLSLDGFNEGFKSLTFKMLSPDSNRFFILFYVDYNVSVGKVKAEEYASNVINEVLKAFNYSDFGFLNGEVNVYSSIQVKRAMGWGNYTLENIYSFLSQSKSVVQPLVDSYFLGSTSNRGIAEIDYCMNSTFSWSLTIAFSETEKLIDEKVQNKTLKLTELFPSTFLENVDEVKITIQQEVGDWHIYLNSIQPNSYIVDNSEEHYWTFRFENAKPIINNIAVTFTVKNEEADKPWTPSIYDVIIVSCSTFAIITGILTIKKWRKKKK